MLKPSILFRFLLRRFFSGIGIILLIVCGIIYAITFVERLPSNPDAISTIVDAWIRLLEYIPMFLPLTVFMGTLLAMYNLTKSSEGIIISSAGRSPYQIARPFLVGAAIIGVFATTVINPYFVKISSDNLNTHDLQLVDDTIWIREEMADHYLTMAAKNLTKRNKDLIFHNAKVFVQNKDFKLTNRIEAANITLSNHGLVADKAQIWDDRGNVYNQRWEFDTRLTTQTVLDRYLQPNQISFWELPKFIQKMTAVNVPVRGHLVQFWTLLFLPLTMIAMAALGIAFSQTRQRRNFNFGLKFSLGIVTCFVMYFLINTFNALGATGALPPILAIIAPPIIIIAAAGSFIEHFDTI
ncbi:MAG: LptF/LptG family permease [Alphaproteobacteria bacterium]|nr:LptF/LptG family permease [Alphaproteobacteria bacterium]